MKKNIIRTAVFAATVLLFGACSEQKNNTPATISGTWERRGGATEVSLYNIVSGRIEKLADYQLQADKQFTFAFMPATEGYYLIGSGRENTPAGKHVFYFKPGDNLNLTVNDSSYVLTGANTKENKAIAAWHDYVLPLEMNGLYPTRQTYVEFFPLLEEKIAKEYKAGKTGNKAFDKSFAKFRKFDLMLYACGFVMSPRTAHPEVSDFPEFYRTISLDEVTSDDALLAYPYMHRIVTGAAYMESRLNGANYSPTVIIEAAKDDVIKGEMFLLMLANVKELAAFESLKEKYEHYIITEDQQQRFEKYAERIMQIHLSSGIGKKAVNFTYKDAKGKNVSLSDFKGKVVYVDVWATWCGPCRKEIPHLKELEKKFHGNKDIVFMGISTDAPKDIQKWKDFILAEQLSGVQLHGNTGDAQDITKLYQISGIPRFLLFDKQGNIVSTDAPRPSSPEIEPLLRSLLK